VSKEDSLATVERLIFKFLGSTWQQFVACLVIQQSQQEQLRRKLEKKLEVKLPADLSIEQLKEMAVASEVAFFKEKWNPLPASSVFQEELRRFGHVEGSEFGLYVSWLALFEADVYGFGTGWLSNLPETETVELERLLVGEVFAVLHGQPMPPRKAKAQELLIQMVTTPPTPTRSEIVNTVETETEDYIL
jgi:hypothetical protein